jgi:hypothetical protein
MNKRTYYRPKVNDVVFFRLKIRGRLRMSEGWITAINSDRTYEIRVTSGFHYSNVPRRHIIEKFGTHHTQPKK